MSARLLAFSLVLSTLLASGCCWCHRWHRHCCYPTTAAAEVSPAPVASPLPGR